MSFPRAEGSGLQEGEIGPASQALIGAWALGLGKGDGADFRAYARYLIVL